MNKGAGATERIDPVTGELTTERDRFFDPWRVPSSAEATTLVGDVLNQLQRYEQHREPRRRKRRKRDQEIFEKTVSAVICDLIHTVLVSDAGIVIPRSNRVLGKKSRYRPVAYGKTLPHLLDMLATPEMDFVEQDVGYLNPFGRNRRTLVRPGSRLLTRIADRNLDLSDLGRDIHQEVIVLKAPKVNDRESPEAIEYDDTDATRRMRADLQRINARLEAAEIDVLHGYASEALDTAQRRLRRVFTYGSFDSGGRLYGGFWQGMKKEARKHSLRIDGEQTVELDYGQMAPRLLYAYAGQTMAQEDAYLIGDLAAPELFREGFKKLFNAMLFATEPLKRKPQGTKRLLPNYPVDALIRSIEEAHRPIAHLFHTGIGHHLQFLESELMVELLLELGERTIVALPIHDSVIVSREREAEAAAVMRDVFRHRTNAEPILRRTASDS